MRARRIASGTPRDAAKAVKIPVRADLHEGRMFRNGRDPQEPQVSVTAHERSEGLVFLPVSRDTGSKHHLGRGHPIETDCPTA